ncbi:MAG: hypothetical protein K5987_06830 [Lachnospiraceae bacterium]|nr:hypothetical protein [Lachnospiraceae bacterium]
MMNIAKKEKYKSILVWLFFICFDAAVVILGFHNKPLNSDVSNHILQAKDLISGNLMYKGWTLSRINFLTGDMLFYELAVALKGVSYQASILANALMVLAVQLISYHICCFKSELNLKGKLAALGVIMVPSISLLRQLMMHPGCWIYCLAAFMIYMIMNEEGDTRKRNKFCVIYVVLMALGVFGDFLIYLYGLMPCFIYSMINWYREDDHKKRKRHIILAFSNVFAAITGWIITFLYYYIGGADKGGYVLGLSFLTLEEFGKKIVSLIHLVMYLCGADFTGKKALYPSTVLNCFNFLLLLTGIALFFYTLIGYIRKREHDIISVLLDLSIIMAAIPYIFTTQSQDRYVSIIPIALYMLIVRNAQVIWNNSGQNLKLNQLIALGVVVISMAGRMYGIVESSRAVYSDKHEELTAFLQENGLYNGYASYWHSSISTVLSDENVCIRHVEKNRDGKISRFVWFGKEEWYHEESHFVVIDNSKKDRGETDGYEVSEKNSIATFGTPDARLEHGDFIILVYDEDISGKLGTPDAKSSHF